MKLNYSIDYILGKIWLGLILQVKVNWLQITKFEW